MSFETDLKKLQKMYQFAQENKINLDFSDIALGNYNVKLQTLNPAWIAIINLIDKGGPYQAVQVLLDTTETFGDQGSITRGVNIDVTINNMPYAWVPFVRFNIGTDLLLKPPVGFLSWFTEVESPNTNGSIVKATWHLGYTLTNPSNDFRFKIYLTLVPPTVLY